MEWLAFLGLFLPFAFIGCLILLLNLDKSDNSKLKKKNSSYVEKLIEENGPITRAFVKYYRPCIIDEYDVKLGDKLYKEYYYEEDDIFQEHQCTKEICVEKIDLKFDKLNKECVLTFNNGITGYMTSYEWKNTCFSNVRYIAVKFKNNKKVVLYDSKRTRTMTAAS